MAEIVDSSPSVFAIDRAAFISRGGLVAAIKFHLAVGSIVQLENSTRPRNKRLCYEARPSEAVFRLFDTLGRPMGVFVDFVAMIDHAETVTGV